MKGGKATVGLFSLHCACGLQVRSVDVLQRTETGRETLRHYCYACGCVSWWWRVRNPHEKIMLIDREEKPVAVRRWPPIGWTRRHMAPRRTR